MNHIIETIGRWGVKTSPAQSRFSRLKPGDIVDFGELRGYPVSCRHCRVQSVEAGNRVSIVDGMGSAFLGEDASLSISGGPFFGMPLAQLEPTYSLKESTFWNWGDNDPGASMGVKYVIYRPVFRALCLPEDFQVRYGLDERSARQGGTYRHNPIPEHATITGQWDDHLGLTAFEFDVRTRTAE